MTVSFEDRLAEWQRVSTEVKRLQNHERELRNSLFVVAFPHPKEGTNNLTLADGRILKAKYSINRSVDPATVEPVVRSLVEMNVPGPQLFPIKYDFSKSVYNKLSDDARKIADRAIIAKPGSVMLEVV